MSWPAFAQGTAKVQFSTVLLTREQAGWRVAISDPASSRYGLMSGDLLVWVDGNDASTLGPLAMTAFMNNALLRAFPVTIVRGDQRTELILYRSEGKVPATEKLTKKSSVATGAEAPDFSLPSLQGGKSISLKDYRGKWVLLNFWATWCAPCQAESPILSRLARAYPQQLQVLAVAMQVEHKDLVEFADHKKTAYTILESSDLKSAIALSYGVNNGMGSSTLPINVLIRPDGTVAYVQGGYETPSPLEKQVSDALSQGRKSTSK
ncbi:MAG: TlpA disulfide reductase family protein [Terriglobales bacterium]